MNWASAAARLIRVTACCAVVVAGIGASAAGADEGPYSIAATALTGPEGTTLSIELTQPASAPPVTALDQVDVRLPADPPRMDVRILRDVPVHDGIATIELRRLERRTPVSVQV